MKRNKKVRKVSIIFKILIIVILFTALSSLSIATISGTSSKKNVIEVASHSYVQLGELISQDIDTSGLSSLKTGMENSEYYISEKKNMQSIADKWNIRYIYTLYKNGEDIFYGIDADSSDEAYPIGEKFVEDFEYLEPVFNGESIADTEFVEEDDMFLLSAYAPLYYNNEIIGILGLDFDCTDLNTKIQKQRTSTSLLSLMIIIISSTTIALVITRILKNLSRINNKLVEIVDSNGDLTKKIEINSGDEIENLGNSLNDLLLYIKNIISNINENSKKLKLLSEQLTKNVTSSQENSTNISATMQQMSAASEETAASIEEIIFSSNNINTLIKEFYDKSKESKTLVDGISSESQKTYEISVTQKELSSKNVSDITDRVQKKIEDAKSVKEIENLTTTILEIANQTNLLSLNAAIEASHAGDAGKGFSVVASEIGKLASNATTAANKIKEISNKVISSVNSLTDETDNMIRFVRNEITGAYDTLIQTSVKNKDNMEKIDETIAYIEKEALSISTTINEIDENLNAISIAVDENAKGISEINISLVDLTEGISDVDSKSSEINSISSLLDKETNKFII